MESTTVCLAFEFEALAVISVTGFLKNLCGFIEITIINSESGFEV